jgi:tyrosine-protein phosphatase YwqE
MLNPFKSFFKKSIEPQKVTQILKTDIHSHLIPGIDDGAQNMEETEFLISALQQLGYTKFITTPHINSAYPNSADTILKKFNEIQNFLYSHQIQLEIAAEYMLDDEFEKHFKNGLLSFGKQNFVLIETSHFTMPERFKEWIFEIQLKGYKPVFAHPERYLYLWDKKDKFFELKELGLFFQVNLNSLTGYYTEMPLKIAKFLMKNNLVDFFGTDTHHAKHIEMLQISLSDETVWNYVQSGKILNATL